MNELKACPFCGGEASLFTTDEIGYIGDEHFTVKCNGCFCGTGHYADPERAIEAWNRRAQQPNNPLTLKELPCFEPIYVVPLGSSVGEWSAHWCIYQIDNATAKSDTHKGRMWFLYDTDYGKTWLAYDHKPEGSEEK